MRREPSERGLHPQAILALVLLFPSFPLPNPQRRHTVVFLLPGVEARLLDAFQAAGAGSADVVHLVATQQPMEDRCYAPAELWHRERGGPYFFPAWLPASGTRWR